MSLVKPFNGEKSSENGSNSSRGGGSGNNSDNSALVSIGNTSFGFNFDSEEGNNSHNSNNSEEGDSDGSNQGRGGKSKSGNASKSNNSRGSRSVGTSQMRSVSSGNSAAAAAAAAVERLQSIASDSAKKASEGSDKPSLKRKSQESVETDGGGYNSDDEDRTTEASETANEPNSMMEEADTPTSSDVAAEEGTQKGGGKKRKVAEMKREERNAREKERSFRISKQINELRNLLSSGGVIVPKGTKSSVLTEAANYIRMLQQHQYRSEIDRHQLVQQIQMIGGGALGQQAATAVRHVAAQNGVWSLGNFGGMPPKSAMMYHQPGGNQIPGDTASGTNASQQASPDGSILPNMVEEPDYRFVFNSCTVGMAIASMGGAFIDCNKLFSQLSNYTKQEVCSMTIFNFTAREDLQHAFDLISQMLSAPTDPSLNPTTNSCVLRGSMKSRTDLGLSVTLIKGEDGVAKCFCVTLIRNPAHPFDPNRPVPATAEYVQSSSSLEGTKASGTDPDPTPRYTTG